MAGYVWFSAVITLLYVVTFFCVVVVKKRSLMLLEKYTPELNEWES